MDAHGSYEIELVNQVIIVRFQAAWNRETSERMCADFLKVAEKIATKPWACLIDLGRWGLGGPDVLEPIEEVNKWCATHNQMHEAVICSQTLQEYILRDLQQGLPHTRSEFFDNENDATAWLRQQGYAI